MGTASASHFLLMRNKSVNVKLVANMALNEGPTELTV